LELIVPAASLALPDLRFTLAQAEHVAKLACSSKAKPRLFVCSRPHAAATAALSGAAASQTSSHIVTDALGVVFSFLSLTDFFSAIAVNRQWHSLRSRPAAWPALLQPCPCIAGKLSAALVHALDSDDATQLLSATSAFRQLARYVNSNECLEAMMQQADAIAPRLVRLLAHESEQIVFNALVAITGLLSGDDQTTQAVLDAGVLPALAPLIEEDSPARLQQHAAFAISNVTAGSLEQIELVHVTGLIAPLIRLACQEKEAASESPSADGSNKVNPILPYRAPLEAMFALCNAITSYEVSVALQLSLLHAGVMKPLLKHLSLSNPDGRVLLEVLDTCRMLLNSAGESGLELVQTTMECWKVEDPTNKSAGRIEQIADEHTDAHVRDAARSLQQMWMAIDEEEQEE
jgi:hypothetical protein